MKGAIGFLKRHERELANPDNEIYVSQASLWEMTMKISIGKLFLSISLSELEIFLIERQFQIFETKYSHYEILQQLPFHHQDPFDRLLIAQAKAENYTLVTHDDKFKMYNVQLF